jgi:hypothetical protein
MQAPAKPALYDRLGGVYNIATVVNDLIGTMTDLQRRDVSIADRPLRGFGCPTHRGTRPRRCRW